MIKEIEYDKKIIVESNNKGKYSVIFTKDERGYTYIELNYINKFVDNTKKFLLTKEDSIDSFDIAGANNLIKTCKEDLKKVRESEEDGEE